MLVILSNPAQVGKCTYSAPCCCAKPLGLRNEEETATRWVVSLPNSYVNLGMNMADLFGRIQQMQSQMQDLRQQLDQTQVEAEAGGGLVRVEATASRRILKLHIDPELLKDPEMLEDLVCAAVNKAIVTADEKAQAEVSRLTGGIMPNLPGLDLGKFGL